MWKKEFDTTHTSAVGFMEDGHGAKWLVDNTNIKLVGKTFNILIGETVYIHVSLCIYIDDTLFSSTWLKCRT